MSAYIYRELPRFCVAFKPKMVLVRSTDGLVNAEYLGPADGDAAAAEIELLRREVAAAYRILLGR